MDIITEWTETDPSFWHALSESTARRLRIAEFDARSRAARRYGWPAARAARLLVRIADGEQPRFALAGLQQ